MMATRPVPMGSEATPNYMSKFRLRVGRRRELAFSMKRATAPESLAGSAAGDGANDEERLGPRRDRIRQRRVRRVVGKVLLAGEEADKRAAFLRDVIADRSAQHRITGFQRVEQLALGQRAGDIERHRSVDARQRSQMIR